MLRADEPVVFLLVPVYHCFKAIPGDDGAAARLCQFSPPPRIANQGRHGRRERGGITRPNQAADRTTAKQRRRPSDGGRHNANSARHRLEHAEGRALGM